MKPTREEILKLAHECLLVPTGIKTGVYMDYLERFALAMYRRGAEDMRERAATLIERTDLSNLPTDWQLSMAKILSAYIDSIRALPIGDSND